MKYFISFFILVAITHVSYSQLGVEKLVSVGNTYAIKVQKDKCTDGKCKEGNTGTLLYKSYEDIKEFTGLFGPDQSFIKGLLKFHNGDEFDGTFRVVLPDHNGKYVDVYYDSGTFKKSGRYTYTARFVNEYPEGQIEINYDNGANYKGQIKKGYYDGYGVLKYSDGALYEGNWVEGYSQGKGKIVYKDGLTYEGDFIKDKREGHGILTNRNNPGYYFSGVFKNDNPNGLGKIVLNSGDTLVGEYNEGKRFGFFQKKGAAAKSVYQYFKKDSLIYDNLAKVGDVYCIGGDCKTGKGKLVLFSGDKYEGDVKDGVATGEGKIAYTNGVLYTGSFKNNMPNGTGKIVYTDAGYYEGNFINGKFEGKGSIHYPAGNIYEGDWVNGERTGIGTYNWPDGDKYVGGFNNNKLSGKGIFYYKNGNSYDGTFADGEYSGSGTFTFVSGDKYVSDEWNRFAFSKGRWVKKDGSTVEGILKDNNFLDAAALQNADLAQKQIKEKSSQTVYKTYIFSSECSSRGKTFNVISKVKADINKRSFDEIKYSATHLLSNNGWSASNFKYLGLEQDVHITGTLGRDYVISETFLAEFK